MDVDTDESNKRGRPDRTPKPDTDLNNDTYNTDDDDKSPDTKKQSTGGDDFDPEGDINSRFDDLPDCELLQDVLLGMKMFNTLHENYGLDDDIHKHWHELLKRFYDDHMQIYIGLKTKEYLKIKV